MFLFLLVFKIFSVKNFHKKKKSGTFVILARFI